MDHYHKILRKLEAFSKKYYTKMLIKGVIMFFALGALFTLALLGLEYLLWLGTTGRFLLFLAGITALLYLFIGQIGLPLLYLFRLRNGISQKEASRLIGQHFPDVGDRLYNLLDLAESTDKSELLLASIAQRSERLSPVPFNRAVDLGENRKYIKYLLFPLLLVGIIWITGKLSDFLGSYKRVVNYDVAYQPPAPFDFVLLSDQEEILENEEHVLQVTTRGSVQPEEVYVVINNQEYLLKKINGIFEHSLTPPLKDVQFYFRGSGVTSGLYELRALEIPVIKGFEMSLDYPNYLGMAAKTVKGTGNAVIPEGTKVSWKIRTESTKNVSWSNKDTTLAFQADEDVFLHNQAIFRNTNYSIKTSNSNVSDFESLSYSLEVIPDAYPTIKVIQALDSLNPNVAHYEGTLEDDHGIDKLTLVYYPKGQEEQKKSIELDIPNEAYQRFYYSFPDRLEIDQDSSYDYYFEVRDNDALRGGKNSRSQLFTSVIYNELEMNGRQLQYQQELIKQMDQSVDRFKEDQRKLDEIRKEQKEKGSLSFNDQRRVSDFIKRQQQQEGMMEKFSRQLKENLRQKENADSMNELLQERLERQEMEARKNQQMLQELQRLSDKINKEELSKRLEELGKKQQSNQRSLEQILELTKRYYVTEKTAQLARELKRLGEKQTEEGNPDGKLTEKKEQEGLNQEFKRLKSQLDTLMKDNQGLKKPLSIERNEDREEQIQKEQEEISNAIEEEESRDKESEHQNGERNDIKNQQKSAGQKIRKMAEDMESAMSGASGGSSIAEDAEMLRQILDNLITFSFKQEQLFEDLQSADPELGQFAEGIRSEQQLRKMFEHVDDSLFALSLRRAELSEVVNEQITEVYYNIDKSLESIAENRIYQGVSYQQYVLTAANELADFLADILENMQQSLSPGSGQGKGDFQLQDIIMSQEEIKKQMQKMGEGKGNEQKEGGDAQGTEQGEREGKSGKDGKENSGNERDKQGQGRQSRNNALDEEQLKDIYDIYKEQEEIRQRLEKQLSDMISKEDRGLANRILRQMQQFQEDLLENGVTKRTNDRLNAIQYQLLKLKDAEVKQGQMKERESDTARKVYRNPLLENREEKGHKQPQTEILNRQALPLRRNYQRRVQRYFNNND
ncbi:DUF4175 family protein [Lentiprolixibacter aurantiacus]|uniref:DUF4175 family protein n=1 Tax=Lentiprolixibacter aurantiacus TaxID=2993939 RepID=A0AAE3SNI6_9FLAO|nr:DUF4175 family protein [Lentiprolixibacter aurantiacus]MCX2718517.1 hypothetical protein [Lentiprolixibacter aurantiacus]